MYRTLVDVDALAVMVDEGRVALFDCRFHLNDPDAGRAAFEAGHIPEAEYLDLEHDLSAPASVEGGRHPLPDREGFAARLRTFGVRSGDQVVVYDDVGGSLAARAWWMLRWIGHEAVALLDGGLAAWAASGRALESGLGMPRPEGDIMVGPALVGTVDTADIVAALGSDRLLVIDARTPARFAGKSHPLDTAAGHIPGARNRFWGDNLIQNGRFKPAEALRAEFDAVLAGVSPANVALQCGSGVTACHDLLAMEIAGLNGARLYPGSWSAWTGDPARPIA
ncbi:sulfurtransferase [Sphingomonas sp. MMS24-J13]|uniref:sulfurtransferase n=1 Tax=Sphingomonas sp. MMS24-J13 TaxID=3238686 RepID=UPI00384B83B8